jgi:hypothetical protein
MEDTLITIDTAKLAKEVGFREIVLSYYNCNKDGVYSPNAFNQQDYVEQEADDWNGDSYISTLSAPTQSLLQKWLRDNYYIYISVTPEIIGSDEWDYKFNIEWIALDKQDEKRRCAFFNHYDSYKEGIGSYSGAWRTYEEALEEGLKYALSKLVIPRRKKGEIL